MRRRLEYYIPIVLFALLVQLLAPVGAFRAVAQLVSDPLTIAPICSGMSPGDGQTMPSHAPDSQADCCGFCAAGHGGVAVIDPPVPAFVVLHRLYQRVVWLEAADAPAGGRAGSNAQARAPPIFS